MSDDNFDHDEGPGLLASPHFWFLLALCVALLAALVSCVLGGGRR